MQSRLRGIFISSTPCSDFSDHSGAFECAGQRTCSCGIVHALCQLYGHRAICAPKPFFIARVELPDYSRFLFSFFRGVRNQVAHFPRMTAHHACAVQSCQRSGNGKPAFGGLFHLDTSFRYGQWALHFLGRSELRQEHVQDGDKEFHRLMIKNAAALLFGFATW